MAQEDFTSLSVSKKTKEMLMKVKGDKNISYSKIIQNLIEESGGVIVEDVVTIQREKVAFTLKYWNDETTRVYDVTYADLASDDIGTMYIAENNPRGDSFVNSRAEIVYKDYNDVLLMVEEVKRENDEVSRLKSVVHVYLF